MAPTPRSTATERVAGADRTRPRPTSASRASKPRVDNSTPPTRRASPTWPWRSASRPTRLRRDFQRVLGVSPKQYADGQRVERLRAELRDGRDVTGALYTAGYGSSSRLYEQSDARLGMTPASYGAGGAGASIAFTVSPSPLGALIVATTARGVCWIALGAEAVALEEGLRCEFPAADAIDRDDDALAPVVTEVLRRIDGELPNAELPLDVRGTAFQLRVWQELQRIPRGETRSYGEVAAAVGVPGGARAVGAGVREQPGVDRGALSPGGDRVEAASAATRGVST